MNPYPNVIPCPDPETCDELHNDELPNGEIHHYGCECEDCVEFYRRLKR